MSAKLENVDRREYRFWKQNYLNGTLPLIRFANDTNKLQ